VPGSARKNSCCVGRALVSRCRGAERPPRGERSLHRFPMGGSNDSRTSAVVTASSLAAASRSLLRHGDPNQPSASTSDAARAASSASRDRRRRTRASASSRSPTAAAGSASPASGSGRRVRTAAPGAPSAAASSSAAFTGALLDRGVLWMGGTRVPLAFRTLRAPPPCPSTLGNPSLGSAPARQGMDRGPLGLKTPCPTRSRPVATARAKFSVVPWEEL
jgi:hypothetical protein